VENEERGVNDRRRMKHMKLLKAAVVLGLMLCMFAVGQSQQQLPKPAGQTGRYQISLYQGEMPRMNTYLLDTVTGRVWVMVAAPDQTTFWEPMYKVDSDGEETLFVSRHGKKPTESQH
jgi:hypothetical protein